MWQLQWRLLLLQRLLPVYLPQLRERLQCAAFPPQELERRRQEAAVAVGDRDPGSSPAQHPVGFAPVAPQRQKSDRPDAVPAGPDHVFGRRRGVLRGMKRVCRQGTHDDVSEEQSAGEPR